MEVDLSKKKIWGRNDILSFGKYKGSTIKDVMKDEPSYLVWCHNNIGWFEIDEYLLLQCEERVELEAGRGRRDGRIIHDEIDDKYFPDEFDDEIPF